MNRQFRSGAIAVAMITLCAAAEVARSKMRGLSLQAPRRLLADQLRPQWRLRRRWRHRPPKDQESKIRMSLRRFRSTMWLLIRLSNRIRRRRASC